VLFQQFTDEISSDNRLTSQLATWLRARSRWRTQWSSRTASSPDIVLKLFLPNPTSASQDQWVHPVADAAPELDSWRIRWQDATRAERNELAAAFLETVALIEKDPASASDACALLARSAGGHALPLAALTPALSSLDPARFVVLCEAWLQLLGQYEAVDLPRDVSAYPELNNIALRWLAVAEGDSLGRVFDDSPHADRFGVFCSWIVRASLGASNVARFDVSRKKYKDWPPMW
jgi:hypothetical protein